MLKIKRLFSSQFRINMLSGVITSIVNVIAMAVAYPVYLSFLDYEVYGVWLVLAVMLNLAQLGDLGISIGVTKLVSEEYGKNNIRDIESYVLSALAGLFISGSVILVIIICFGGQIVGVFNLSGENEATALRLLPYIGVLSVYVLMVQVPIATLSGLGRMDLANYCRALSKVVTVGIATVLLWKGYGIESLLAGNILAFTAVHIMSVIFIRRTAKIRFFRTGRLDREHLRKLLDFGGTVFGSSMISMLLSPFNKMMLSRYAGVATVPIYEIAYNSSVQIRTLIDSALRPIMPEISRLSGHKTTSTIERIRTINRRAMKLILFLGLPFFGVLLLAARPLLQVWLGDAYDQSIPVAFCLMLICVFVSLTGVPAFHTLLGLGKTKCYLVSVMIISGGNFILVGVTALWAGHIRMNGIFAGLIFLSVISTVYLLSKVARETRKIDVSS